MGDPAKLVVCCVDGDEARRAKLADAVVDAAGDTTDVSVLSAGTADAAADLVTDPVERVHCVLSAAQLPDSSAIGCVDAVRADTDVLPVIVVAPDHLVVADEALAAGATDVVAGGSEQARRLAARRAIAAGREFRTKRQEPKETPVDSLFENTSDAIVVADLDGDSASIRHANDAFAEMFGGDSAELAGQDIDEVVHPPDRRDIGYELNQRVADGEYVETEGKRMTVDGARDFLLRSVRLGDGSDRAYFVYTDITERKHREKILHLMHDATREMMVAETKPDVAKRAVATGLNVLGLPKTTVYLVEGGRLEPVGTTCSDGPTPIRLDRETPLGRQFATNETSVCSVARGEDERTVLVVPLGDHGILVAGDLPQDSVDDATVQVAELLATHIVSALERAEREDLLREREDELKQQRDRFAALFQNVPDPAVSYVFDAEGTMQVTAVNAAFEEVMGYDAETVVGSDLDGFIVPPGDGDEATGLNDDLIAGNSMHVEVRRQTASGVRDFILHGVPVTLGERSVFGFAIYSDTTEQKERERQLRRQNERLDEFASIVSHDLRNPLTVARGHRDLVAAEVDHDSLDEIAWALGRMETLIEDVLTLARQGKSVEDPEPISFERVVTGAWAACDTPSATLDLDGEFPSVLADGERLAALVENLVRNAVVHGREDATVTVTRLPDGFAIADDGSGIPDDEVDVVFDQGYTTATEGTGFGLAIVEDIAKAHDWTVELDCEVDGARFVFSGVEWCDDAGTSAEPAEPTTPVEPESPGESAEPAVDGGTDGEDDTPGGDDERDGAV
ncbi:PAS domain S-box protein [Haloarchaeobius sp. DFWS5]|uniref:PAS domain S-box protein n=1 Tax=Haloarchaeobius sp. DFWS5 TaxID=3446114 RepID=UPI003EBC6418